MFGLLVLAAFTSCGDDDKFSPGAPVDADSPQAYFETASVSGSAKPGETKEYTCTVKRSNTSAKVTVPINASILRISMSLTGSWMCQHGRY